MSALWKVSEGEEEPGVRVRRLGSAILRDEFLPASSHTVENDGGTATDFADLLRHLRAQCRGLRTTS